MNVFSTSQIRMDCFDGISSLKLQSSAVCFMAQVASVFPEWGGYCVFGSFLLDIKLKHLFIFALPPCLLCWFSCGVSFCAVCDTILFVPSRQHCVRSFLFFLFSLSLFSHYWISVMTRRFLSVFFPLKRETYPNLLVALLVLSPQKLW